MSVSSDRVTRFASDLIDSATVEGARQSRSAKQQLDHWARVGRSVSMHHTAARRRVEAALDGTLALTHLNADERLVVDAEIDAAIQENLHVTDYGTRLASEGITTVTLDENGKLIEHHPDGTSNPLQAPAR
jgi:hypothetical protein